MLVYNLMKIAPNNGELTNTTLGMLFGLMEVGLAIWFAVSMFINF